MDPEFHGRRSIGALGSERHSVNPFEPEVEMELRALDGPEEEIAWMLTSLENSDSILQRQHAATTLCSLITVLTPEDTGVREAFLDQLGDIVSNQDLELNTRALSLGVLTHFDQLYAKRTLTSLRHGSEGEVEELIKCLSDLCSHSGLELQTRAMLFGAFTKVDPRQALEALIRLQEDSPDPELITGEFISRSFEPGEARAIRHGEKATTPFGVELLRHLGYI